MKIQSRIAVNIYKYKLMIKDMKQMVVKVKMWNGKS